MSAFSLHSLLKTINGMIDFIDKNPGILTLISLDSKTEESLSPTISEGSDPLLNQGSVDVTQQRSSNQQGMETLSLDESGQSQSDVTEGNAFSKMSNGVPDKVKSYVSQVLESEVSKIVYSKIIPSLLEDFLK